MSTPLYPVNGAINGGESCASDPALCARERPCADDAGKLPGSSVVLVYCSGFWVLEFAEASHVRFSVGEGSEFEGRVRDRSAAFMYESFFQCHCGCRVGGVGRLESL